MIATRFRSVVSTGGACLAILSFYMMSQTVAAKRAELARVDREIVQTKRAITQLETEIGTRAGMGQVEHWNASVYGLQAPGVGQFVNSPVQLAALVQPTPRPLDPTPAANDVVTRGDGVQMASATVPAPAPVPVTPPPVAAPAAEPQPSLRVASYVQARPSALAPSTVSAVHEASLQKPARLTITTPVEPKVVAPKVVPIAKAVPKLALKPAAKPARMTSLDDSFLEGIPGVSASKPARKARP